MNIPQDILDIHSIFKENGKDLFLVGGCVRDFVLGKEPNDFDMVSDAHPDEIEKILSDYEMDLTGKQFGVMRVYTTSDPKGYEIATYREDETTGRKPKVKVGSTIHKAALRRDFTINSLYYDIETSKIIDLVGGIKDIDSKLIKACGDPNKRIEEDALRILRAIRFKNTIGGKLDPDLHDAIKNNPVLECPDSEGNIIKISQERICEEFMKGVSKSNGNDYVDDLIKYNLIHQVFPQLRIHSDGRVNTKKIEIVLAYLLTFNTDHKKLFTKLVHSSKFSSRIAEGVIFLLSLGNFHESRAHSLRRQMEKTDVTMDDVLLYGTLLPHSMHPFIEAFSEYSITTDGNRLLEEGFVPGPELGKEIQRRETEQFLNIYNAKRR